MKLPILVTVPHGGRDLPSEASACLLDPYQIASDGDTWANDLYQLHDQVHTFLDTDIPRAIVDLNRDVDDRPPENPDGVVKTVTVDGTQVWPDRQGPQPDLIPVLLDRYYTPWHQAVAEACLAPDLLLGLDCHTMLAIGPHGHALAGEPRPLICLSNHGDSEGEKDLGPLSAPAELAHLFFDNLTLVFHNEDVDIDIEEPKIRLNDPFSGGYISSHHAERSAIPWLQLELSRALYLHGDFAPDPGVAEMQRLNDLRNKILTALRRTF